MGRQQIPPSNGVLPDPRDPGLTQPQIAERINADFHGTMGSDFGSAPRPSGQSQCIVPVSGTVRALTSMRNPTNWPVPRPGMSARSADGIGRPLLAEGLPTCHG